MQLKSKDSDFYYTIEKQERAELKEKGSRFIATVSPCVNKEQAMEFINQIRAEFYDATHNCFAYILGYDGSEYRFSDDGEPSGSAGKPILSAIQKYDLRDVACVVTRYFGGVKLGVGGLVRAYSGCAELALQNCHKKKVYLTEQIIITVNYNDLQITKKILEKNAVNNLIQYSDFIQITSHIPINSIEEIITKITNATQGRARIEKIKHKI